MQRRNRVLHRFFVYLTAVLLVISAVVPAAAQPGEQTWVMAGFDGDSIGHDWETNVFFERMYERTGMSFEFKQYQDFDAWTEAKKQMLADGEVPDVLFKAELNRNEIAAFAQKGLLLDLAPLLEEHAPNVYRCIQANEEVKNAITQPDGKILTLPNINELPNNNVIWVNSQWLQRLKIDMPANAAEFREMLEAFKTKDPNGNGNHDEIPMTYLGIWDLKFLGHAFGLIANDYNLFVDEQGQMGYLALQPQFRPFVEWLRDLYKDGLIDQRGFTTFDSARKVLEEKSIPNYGVLMGTTTMNLLPYADTSNYAVLQPLEWEGKQVYRDLFGTVYPGAFALSADCPEPEKVLAWIDYLYTDEGGKMALAGLEGEEYETDPVDGVWEWIGDIATRGQQIIQDVTISESGYLPWRYPVEFQLKYGDRTAVSTLEQLYQLRQHTKAPFPAVRLLEDDARRIAELQYDLGLYLDTQISCFIIGQDEITDESWQAFLDTLNEKGLQEFLAIWENYLDS